MTDEQQAIADTVRAVLTRNGVYMTPKGPVGPEQVTQESLSTQCSTREAIDRIAERTAKGESQ